MKSNQEKELLFSLSAENGDFVIEPYRGSGAGGQHRNKTMSGIRIKHPASGAVGQSCNERSQHQNKKVAFRRLIESETFQKWYKRECALRLGVISDAAKYADKEINNSEHLKIEIKDENGKWVEIT